MLIQTFPEHLLCSGLTGHGKANQIQKACCQGGAMTSQCNIYGDAMG